MPELIKPGNTQHLEPTKWKPGQSGNPSGRPSNASLRAALKPHEKTVIDTLIACLADESGSVRMAAVKEFFDRLYGKCEAAKEAPSWLKDEEIVDMLS